MRKIFISLIALLFCTLNMFAAGYTASLSDKYELSGYKVKAFYNFTKENSVAPTTGDLRYREGFGIHNFGSGGRSATVSIPVSAGDILVVQTYDASTFNSISGGTKNDDLTSSTGYIVYNMTDDAESETWAVYRYGGFVSAVVMEKDNSVTTATWTINYKFTDNGNTTTLKSEEGTSAVNSTVKAKSSIKVDGQKYIIKDGETSSMTIGDGSNTLDVELRIAETYVYSLKSSLGTTIAEGSFFEGDTATVNWSKYMKNESDGKWYVAGGTTFSKTYTESVADVVSYQESDIDYFIECENMTKSRSAAATLSGEAYSGGNSPRHYTNSYWYTDVFEKGGMFTLYAPYVNQNKTASEINIYYRDADGNLFDTGKSLTGEASKTSDVTVEGIEIPAGCSLVLYNTTAYNSNVYIDYITLTKTGDIPTSVTKQYANNGTICFEYKADILETSTAKVYMFEGIYQGNVYGSEVTSLEPGMPYIVLAGNLNLSYAKENAAVEGQNCNGLIGVLDSKGTSVKGKDYMIFVGGDIYYASDEGNTVSAGHAYFDVAQIPAGKPQTQEAKALFGFNFDTPTGINAVNALKNDAPVYNIAGQLVSKAQNGIFIVNGKKVVVK